MNRNLRAALLILAIVAGALLLVYWLKMPSPLAFATVAAGIVTFFHMLQGGPQTAVGSGAADKRLRAAIASALVVQYLVLVGLVAYFTNTDAFGKLPPITEALISSFTTTIGIVIAFYFGASAYVEGKRMDADKAKPGPAESRGEGQ